MIDYSHGKLTYNFSAGPCILPRAVLDQCSYDVIDYNGTGQSVMELSHRGSDFAEISENCKQDIRRLLNVPDDFTVILN
jgi:phosphoserine aminotransferase